MRYQMYVITKEGKRVDAFVWTREYDIVSGMISAEKRAKQFGYTVREVGYERLAA